MRSFGGFTTPPFFLKKKKNGPALLCCSHDGAKKLIFELDTYEHMSMCFVRCMYLLYSFKSIHIVAFAFEFLKR